MRHIDTITGQVTYTDPVRIVDIDDKLARRIAARRREMMEQLDAQREQYIEDAMEAGSTQEIATDAWLTYQAETIEAAILNEYYTSPGLMRRIYGTADAAEALDAIAPQEYDRDIRTYAGFTDAELDLEVESDYAARWGLTLAEYMTDSCYMPIPSVHADVLDREARLDREAQLTWELEQEQEMERIQTATRAAARREAEMRYRDEAGLGPDDELPWQGR